MVTGRGKSGAMSCRGCGVAFKHDLQGPDYHTDDCADRDIRRRHLAIVEAVRSYVAGEVDNDVLIAKLTELDETLDRIERAKVNGEL